MIKKTINKFKSSNIGKNFIVLLFGSGVGSVVGILNLSIILNAIGAENNGIIIMIQTYVALFSGIFSFKSFEAIIKYLSVTIQNDNFIQTKKYIKFSFILDILSAIVAIIFAYIFLDLGFKIMGWSDNLRPFVQVYIISLLFNITGTSIGIVRIYNKFNLMVKMGIYILIFKFNIYIIGFFLGYGFNYFFIAEFILTILNNLCIVGLSLFILYKNNLLDFYKTKIRFDKEYFMFNLYSSIYTTIDIPVQQITTFVINKYLGFSEVAVYNIFGRIAGLILKIESPLSQIVYPEMNMRIAKGDKKSAINLYKKLFKIISSIGIGIVIILIGSYNYWMPLFIKDYQFYVVPLIIYLIYVVYTSTSRSIHDLFISLGYIKYNVMILLVINLIYIAILYGFVMKFGLNGVIISLFIQALLVIEVKKFILKKDLHI